MAILALSRPGKSSQFMLLLANHVDFLQFNYLHFASFSADTRTQLSGNRVSDLQTKWLIRGYLA